MTIVAGFDVHKTQITFDALDLTSGEVHRGRIPSSREAVREWVERVDDPDIQVAVEAGTGWLFVCEELAGAGATPHLAEPAETRALRGPKRRAKTDREDARWLRTLLCEGRLPESWIPPAHIQELRTRTRLRKTLIDERTAWLARIQATLFHHGVTGAPERLRSVGGRELAAVEEFNNDLHKSGAFRFAGGLHPPSSAKTVDATSGEPVVVDGPFVEAPEYVGGFWVIEAADQDAAVRWATQASKALGGRIEVRAFQDPPDA